MYLLMYISVINNCKCNYAYSLLEEYNCVTGVFLIIATASVIVFLKLPSTATIDKV
jgi:hypothetical protein